jgi:uncharacterized membrane protein
MPRSNNPLRDDLDGRTWVRASAHILADPNTLYLLWRNPQETPLELSGADESAARWATQFKNKTLIRDEPGRRIVWESRGSALDTGGAVIFEECPGGRGTLVTVLQESRIGKVEKIWQVITGRHPKQAIVENLRNFKARAETVKNQ